MSEITIASFREEYNRATELAKRIQAFRREAGIPAQNELRYAGHHFLRAIGDDGDLKDPDQLIKARNHCRRACYEAVEAGLVYAVNQIAQFKNDFKNIPITGALPNWIQIITDAKAAQKLLGQTRPEPEGQQSEDHERHLEAFDKLEAHIDKLEPAREELNKSLAASRRNGLIAIAGLFLTVLGILITVLLA